MEEKEDDFVLEMNLPEQQSQLNDDIILELDVKKITAEDQKLFLDSLYVENRQAVENLPQGSEAWLKSREGRLTGSIMGTAVGHNFWTTHLTLLDQLLWTPFEGNECTDYGIQNESIARDVYEAVQRSKPDITFTLRETGLIIHPHMAWFAYSPDGLIEENGIKGLLEIKCPFRKKFYGRIPIYYFDQIQFGMWMTQSEFCDFVVYTPEKTSIQRYIFEKDYVEEFLLPRAERFYFGKYLPLLLAKKKQWLRQGECQLPNSIFVESLSRSDILHHTLH